MPGDACLCHAGACVFEVKACLLWPLRRMGIKSLPYLVRIPPSMVVSKDGAVRLKPEDQFMSPKYPWSAEQVRRGRGGGQRERRCPQSVVAVLLVCLGGDENGGEARVYTCRACFSGLVWAG